MRYHHDPKIDAEVVASIEAAKKSSVPAVTLRHCLHVAADDPRWSRAEAVALLDCLTVALQELTREGEV